jgi:hypothetical protein
MTKQSSSRSAIVRNKPLRPVQHSKTVPKVKLPKIPKLSEEQKAERNRRQLEAKAREEQQQREEKAQAELQKREEEKQLDQQMFINALKELDKFREFLSNIKSNLHALLMSLSFSHLILRFIERGNILQNEIIPTRSENQKDKDFINTHSDILKRIKAQPSVKHMKQLLQSLNNDCQFLRKELDGNKYYILSNINRGFGISFDAKDMHATYLTRRMLKSKHIKVVYDCNLETKVITPHVPHHGPRSFQHHVQHHVQHYDQHHVQHHVQHYDQHHVQHYVQHHVQHHVQHYDQHHVQHYVQHHVQHHVQHYVQHHVQHYDQHHVQRYDPRYDPLWL